MEAITLLRNREANLIQWKQLWSLASLYASVIIGWIAYYRYQPILLQQFRFENFSFLLVVAQGIILIVTPPIAGKIGDRYRFSKGHRIPVIAAGISFAAMIFMAVSFTLLSNPGEILRWILPLLIVFWLVGMSIFTSPALSTIELFAPVEKLPLLMAVLTIVSNLVYALEPVIVDVIKYLGAPATFAAGGVAVFLSGYALKKNSISLFQANDKGAALKTATGNVKSPYALMFVMGIGLGLATTVLFNLFPARLQEAFAQWTGPVEGTWIIVLMLLIAAAISWPVSKWVISMGQKKSFWVSLFLVVSSTAGILVIQVPALTLILCLLFVFGITALSVSALPIVIREAAYNEKVFCVGIFYSGVALPDGILECILAM